MKISRPWIAMLLVFILFLTSAETCEQQETTESGGTSQDSSQQSSEDSSQDSSDNSSENSTKDNAGLVAGLLVSTGVVIWLGIRGTVRVSRRNDERRRRRFSLFLQQHHGTLKRDIALAGGRLLQDWAVSFGMTRAEMRTFQSVMEGSAEQKQLLAILSAPLGEKQAGAFADRFVALLRRSLGETRFAALVKDTLHRAGVAEPHMIGISGT